MLSVLLSRTLKNVFRQLEALIFKNERKDWPIICLALVLVFFGAESLQVDIHLQSSHPKSDCEAMEKKSVLVLAHLFKARTMGYSPLDIDWESGRNSRLLDNNQALIAALKRLQSVRTRYSKDTSILGCRSKLILLKQHFSTNAMRRSSTHWIRIV